MKPGFIWVFASSAHPRRTVVLAETLVATGMDAIECVDRSQGWICVFSVFVTDIAANLRALAAELKLQQLDIELDLPAVSVTRALHAVVQGEIERFGKI